MKRKNIVFIIIYFILTILFVAIPFPTADLFIRVNFKNITSNSCSLYYSIDAPFSYSEEQCINSSIDPDLNQVTFRLDSSLANQITDIRLDFANQEDLICIKDISISSAGVIKEAYRPYEFFSSDNIAMTNQVTVSATDVMNDAYISTTGNDPYIIFTHELTRDIMSHVSSYRLTRALICVFIGVAIILMKKKVFTEH